MKIPYLIYSALLIPLLFGCTQGVKHPQAALINQSSATAMTDESILHYADSIQSNLKNLEKQSSLVYLQGEQSMYVEKYSANGKPVLYEEYLDNKLISSEIRKYYLKNDSLILLQESHKSNKGWNETRTFFRNNISFKKDQRSGATDSELKKKPYVLVKSTASSIQTTEKEEAQLKKMDDAIAGSGLFAMNFDQFIDIPEESIIQLKNSEPNGYISNVIVNTPDELIDSLQHHPLKFKGKKINFRWEIQDREAVYVPVGAKVTSAKGLNK